MFRACPPGLISSNGDAFPMRSYLLFGHGPTGRIDFTRDALVRPGRSFSAHGASRQRPPQTRSYCELGVSHRKPGTPVNAGQKFRRATLGSDSAGARRGTAAARPPPPTHSRPERRSAHAGGGQAVTPPGTFRAPANAKANCLRNCQGSPHPIQALSGGPHLVREAANRST